MANLVARFKKTSSITEDEIASVAATLANALASGRAAAGGLEVDTDKGAGEGFAYAIIPQCPDNLVEETSSTLREHLQQLGFDVVSVKRE